MDLFLFFFVFSSNVSSLSCLQEALRDSAWVLACLTRGEPKLELQKVEGKAVAFRCLLFDHPVDLRLFFGMVKIAPMFGTVSRLLHTDDGKVLIDTCLLLEHLASPPDGSDGGRRNLRIFQVCL